MEKRTSSENYVVRARGLVKKYRDLTAVDGVDFSIHKQECFGLLGPNGAGKTTTVRMVSCFTQGSTGSLEVLGFDALIHPRCIKAGLGVCPQENNLDPDLSVWDNLRVFARYFNIDSEQAACRASELLDFVGLAQKKKSAIEELSGGMKRRLMIARALINKPKLLILDEPTTGLDPQARHQVWESIARLKREGTTVLLTTHYMDEAQSLCDRLLIMDHGKIILEGSPLELVRRHVGANVIEVSSENRGIEEYLLGRGLSYEKSLARYFVYVVDGAREFAEISRLFGSRDCVLRMANLEDVFLKATGRELRE